MKLMMPSSAMVTLQSTVEHTHTHMRAFVNSGCHATK